MNQDWTKIKKGSRVKITRKDFFPENHAWHKRKHKTGIVTRVVTGDIYHVRPTWYDHECELYLGEIRLIKS